MLVAGVGIATLVLVPLIWGLLRRGQGLPMFGAPTVAQLEDPAWRPGIVGMKQNGSAEPEAGRGTRSG
jgi:hypothetical protein